MGQLVFRDLKGSPLTEQEGDANVRELAKALTVEKQFNASLTFDSQRQFSQVSQTAPIYFTLTSAGHLNNAEATIIIKPNGTDSITFDNSKFEVKGTVDLSQYSIINFYNPLSDLSVRTLVTIISIPKYGVPVTVSAPSSITGTQTSTGLIQVSWTAGTNATSYVVERSTSSSFNSNLVQVYSGPNLNFTDTTVGASTAYWYRVKGQRTYSSDSAYAVTAQSTSSGANPHIETPQFYRWGTSSAADQNITVANPADFDFSTSAFTVLFFARLNAVGNYLTLGRNNGTDRCYDILVKDDTPVDGGNQGATVGVAFFDKSSTSSSPQYVYKETPHQISIANNNFVRIAVSHDGIGGIKIYINGVEIKNADGTALQTYTGSNGFSSIRTGGTFSIGGNPALSGYTQSNGADIDVLAFANRVLTAAEISEDWNNGVRNSMSGVSFYNSLFAAYYFNSSLQDSIGTHLGSAVNPQFINS